MILLVGLLVAWLCLAYVPARIAASKGRSFVGFYVAGLFCFFPALIVAMAVSRPNIRENDIVRVTRRVELDGGTTIPHGYAAKVLDVDVIDGEPVVLVKGPAGSSHWIAMKAVGAGGGRRAASGGSDGVRGPGAVVLCALGAVLVAGLAYVFYVLAHPLMYAVAGGAVVLLGLKFTGRSIPSTFRMAMVCAVAGYGLLLVLGILNGGIGGWMGPYLVPLALGGAAVAVTRPAALAMETAPPRREPREAPPHLARERPAVVATPSARPLPPPATFRMAPVEDTRQSFVGLDEPTRVPTPVAAPQDRVAAWLDDAAPAYRFDFDKRPQLRYEVVRLAARSPSCPVISPELGVAYDLSSWFPVPEPEEARRAAYVLSVVLLDGSERPQDFAVRGKSTLLVTNRRLVGVCPEGESVRGPFQAETGNVAVWTMALDDIGPATVARSAATEHAIIRSRETRQPWLLLAKPQRVVNGALRPVGLHDVVDLVNHAVSQRAI